MVNWEYLKTSQFLSCNLLTFDTPNNNAKLLSLSVTSIKEVKTIINYFNNYTLLGIKNENFKGLVKVYDIIISKEHLTIKGRSKIELIQSNMHSKYLNKNLCTNIVLMKSISSLLFYIILLGLATYFCVEYIINNFDFNQIIFTLNDSTEPKKVEDTVGTIPKINRFEFGIAQIGDCAVYIGGMMAAAKVVKYSTLPIGAKLGATVGIGAVALLGYKMIQNSMYSINNQATLNVNADKLNTNVDNINNNVNNVNTKVEAFKSNNIVNNYYIDKLVSDSESGNNPNNNNFNISAIDVEQLQLDFYLQVVIIYLLIILLMFLIMKSLSDRGLKMEFLNKLPFIQSLVLKLFKWWGKTNIIWVYIILIIVLVGLTISAWSILIILHNLK